MSVGNVRKSHSQCFFAPSKLYEFHFWIEWNFVDCCCCRWIFFRNNLEWMPSVDAPFLNNRIPQQYVHTQMYTFTSVNGRTSSKFIYIACSYTFLFFRRRAYHTYKSRCNHSMSLHPNCHYFLPSFFAFARLLCSSSPFTTTAERKAAISIIF